MKLSFKLIMYYLGAVSVLVSLIYFKNKSLMYAEKCAAVDLQTSPMELQRLFGKPVASKKMDGGSLEYSFITTPLMDVATRAIFSRETGELLEFYCGERVLIRDEPKD